MNRRFLAVLTSLLTAVLLGFFCADAGAASRYNISAEKKTDTSFTLTWDEADGADAYRVLLYSKKSGKYSVYKTVAAERCTVTGLSPSTSYKVKIRAVKKTKSGYKKVSESGTVTVKTLSGTGKTDTGKTGTKSPAVTPKDMRSWKQYYKDSKSDFDDTIIAGFINKIKNEGYTVDEYPYFSSKTNLSYYVTYNGKVVGYVHADHTKVWFEMADGRAAVPTKIEKESAKVPVSKLREWRYTYDDVGDRKRTESYVVGYFNKFSDAGYTVDTYPYVENGVNGTGYYVYYGDEIVGTAWINLIPYYKSGYSSPTYRVEVSFEAKGTVAF